MPKPRSFVTPRALAALVLALVVLLPSRPAAHDIPSDVTLQAFVKPEGQVLRFLVRVPLEAMRDLDVPVTGLGYLDLTRADRTLRDAATLWLSDFVGLYEDGVELTDPVIVAARVSLPSDRSFESYDQALAHVFGPGLSDDTRLYWEQGMLDVLFEYPIRSENSGFSMHPAFERLGLRVINVIRFLPPDGSVRAFQFLGNPGIVELDPRWHQAALQFVGLGFHHILDGTDHLLFLLCLVIPFRRFLPLIPIVTAFTVAHSITLIVSALGFAPRALWFIPFIETLIAMSIVYMAIENIAAVKLQRRWLITFGFGLVHGFGFSFVLGETMQFAGTHLLTSLLAFNVGVELGQLIVILLMVPVLDLAFKYLVNERMGTIFLSALVAHTGWHWMLERWEALRQFDFALPAFNAAFFASATRWLMLVVLLAAVMWLLSLLFNQPDRQTAGEGATAGAKD